MESREFFEVFRWDVCCYFAHSVVKKRVDADVETGSLFGVPTTGRQACVILLMLRYTLVCVEFFHVHLHTE